MNTNCSIFTIIVTYNGMRDNWLQKCLSSLYSSSVSTQIIAIDNNSADESVDYIRKHFPEVILIESKENVGFGGANNLGLKKALELGGVYFFLLNQDACVAPDTIGKLIGISHEHPEYGIISPIHLNGTGSRVERSFVGFIHNSSAPDLMQDLLLNRAALRDIYSVSFVNAAAWLLTKECLRSVGGFSPTFFHYGEDDNYCHRVLYKGLKIGIAPHSYIYHDTENRPHSVYDQEIEIKIRNIIKDFSNPNHQLDLMRFTRQTRNKMIKATILQHKDVAHFHTSLYKTLKMKHNMILTNLNISKSDQKYSFLNMDLK